MPNEFSTLKTLRTLGTLGTLRTPRPQAKKKPSTIIIVEGDGSENSIVCYFTSGKKRVNFLRTAE